MKASFVFYPMLANALALPQPQESADANSEVWQKVEALNLVDKCMLFEVIKCKGTGLGFEFWGCNPFNQKKVMETCMPELMQLSQEDQDKAFEKIPEQREQREEEAAERKKQEDKERQEIEAAEKQERERWEAKGAAWVKQEGESNTVVTIGDGKLNFGTVKPWDLVNKIPELCPGQSCKAGKKFEFETLLKMFEPNDARKAKVIMSIEGSWDITQDLGSQEQLLEAIKMTMTGLDQAGLVERPKEEWVIGPCNTNHMTQMRQCSEWDHQKKKNVVHHVEQTIMTDHIDVRTTHGPAGKKTDAGNMNIGFSIDLPEIESKMGFCGGVLGAGAGVAGAFTATPAGAGIASIILIGAMFCNV